MKSDKHFHQLPFKKPSPLTNLDSPHTKFATSLTPSLKNLNQAQCATSRLVLNDPQAPISPLNLKAKFYSCQSSPLHRYTPKINKLVKTSLKKFKKAKKELEKIKESAEQWKETRKKKIETYNLQTRMENRKFKLKAFRPSTAWGSPETKEVFTEHEKICQKKRVSSTAERRANIGLEFYNLKSSRNSTPRTLNPEKKEEHETGKRQPSHESKKTLNEFIKKKQKERIRKEKRIREEVEENEYKRLSQLAHIEKTAKKVLRKALKGKPPRPKKSIPVSPKSKPRKNEEKASLGCTQDHEVQKILEKGKKYTPGVSNRGGRECVIFGNISSQFTSNIQDATEIAEKIVGKRRKSENFSGVISSSMPIIELKSVSNTNSSSDSSDQSIPRRVQETRNRVNHIYEQVEPTEKDLNKDIGAHKIGQILFSYLLNAFETIRFFNPLSIDTPQLSAFPVSKNQSLEKPSQKLPLDEMLSKIGKVESREASVDLEKIWDKIEFNAKPTTFLQDPNPLPPLTPIEELQLKSKQGSKKPSEEFSVSITDQLKKVIFPSVEYLSFGNIGEVTHEDLIDSPSLLSIASHNSSEPSSEDFIVFGPSTNPHPQVFPQPEPAKHYLKLPERPNPILIDDGSGSLSDYIGMIKESSSIATPEAEEIEEFSSINFEFNLRRPAPETSLNPFSMSEETLVLDEDEIIEKTVNLLIVFVFQDLIAEEAYQEHRRKNFQLLGNAVIVLHEVYVRTGVSAVMSFVDKIWNKVDSQELFRRMVDWEWHYGVLGELQGRVEERGGVIKGEVLEAAEAPSELSFSLSLAEPPSEPVRVHNRMIFDCINLLVEKIRRELNPSPWKTGEVCFKNVNAEQVLQMIGQELRKFCSVNAGRVPSIAMVGANGQVDEELLLKVRENGLASLLAIDINEGEMVWTDYEFEEAQICIDMADFVLTDLLAEMEIFFILW